VSEKTFKLFMQWLYSQCARTMFNNPSPVDDFLIGIMPYHQKQINSAAREHGQGNELEEMADSNSAQDKGSSRPRSRRRVYNQIFDNLTDLYIFAHYYDTRHLRNDIMSVLRYFDVEMGYDPGVSNVSKAFVNLPVSTSLCRFIVKQVTFTYTANKDYFDDHELAECPKEFLVPLLHINSQRANRRGRDFDKTLMEELNGYCTFHEHVDAQERMDCKSQKDSDTAFVNSLLLACMASVEEDADLVEDFYRSCSVELNYD
jgi:hypothetical protein